MICKYLIAAAAVAAFGAAWFAQGLRWDNDVAEINATHLRASLTAAQASATERDALTERLSEVRYDATEREGVMRLAIAVSDDAGERLQQRVTELQRAATVARPGPIEPTACAGSDLLAELSRSLDRFAGGVAAEAERYRSAGLNCAAEHDAARSAIGSAPGALGP